MTEKVFSKEGWTEALATLKGAYQVFVPVREGDFHNFRVLEEGVRPSFAFQNTRLSPKSVVFPQSERMFVYTVDQSDPEANILKEAPKEFSPQVVVGIRPCDAYAFQLVRKNYDTPEYKDPWWVKRFESTTLVGLGCNAPCRACFCLSTGTGPYSEKGLDAMMVDLGDSFLVRALTPKGEAWMGVLKGGRAAGEAELAEAARLAQEAEEKVVASMPTDQLKDKDAVQLFEAPFWEEVAFSCINCGTCTYLCPTCWCFDIQDEVHGKEGDRIRNWDACMFPLFTLHGSGHNPRAEKYQRVRQRFMHKLKYYVDKYGDGVCCVGCGRCVQFCPVNIDIRRVAQLMNAL